MFEHMDKKIKEDWIDALRSGKFEQQSGSLMKENYPNTPTYCCLGVLCDAVLEVSHYTESDSDEEMFDTLDWFQSQDENYKMNGDEVYESTGSLPTMLREHLGLSETEVSTLIQLNDGVQCDENPTGRKHTFAEIANVLSDGYLTYDGGDTNV